MMGTLWTESSYPGPHALQLTSAETPPLPSSAVNTEAERGRLPAQNHGKAGMVQDWNQASYLPTCPLLPWG